MYRKELPKRQQLLQRKSSNYPHIFSRALQVFIGVSICERPSHPNLVGEIEPQLLLATLAASDLAKPLPP
jgi:hypothetical protein